jgi:hypothetical protein
MNRARLASVLTLLWAAVQVGSLLIMRFYPPRHLSGWGIALALLVISGGLWLQKPWARISLLVVGGVLVVFYATVTYRYGFPCRNDFPGCYPWAISQPFLVVAALAALLWPLASNNRWRGP